MKKTFALFLFLLFAVQHISVAAEITSKEDLDRPGILIGISQGSVVENIIKDELPNASIVYFTDTFMGYESAAEGKIDAFIYDRLQMSLSIQNGQKGVHLLEDTLDKKMQIAVGISPVSKIDELEDKINDFIEELRDDGTLDDMFRRWIVEENDEMPHISLPDDPVYHLTVGTTGTVPPYSYYKGSELNGYDIELAYRLAAWLNADLQFGVYDYGGIVPAASAGKIDCIMANLEIGDERRENLVFSDPLYEEIPGIMVRGENKLPVFDDENVPAGVYSSLSDLSGKRIGIQTGSSFDINISDVIPDAKLVFLNTKADLTNALLANKIDGFIVDEPVAKTMIRSNDMLTYIPEYMDPFDFAFAFRKDDEGEDLCEQFNEFLEQIKDDGTLAEIDRRWLGGDDGLKAIPDPASLKGPNGKLRMATEALYEPFEYISNNRIVGYEIDIVVRFCEAYGYGLDIQNMSFDAVLPAIQTGKCDFGGAGISITPERAESVLFSTPNYSGGTVIVIQRKINDPRPEYSSFSELNGKTISMLNGVPFENLIKTKVADPGGFTYFASMSDLLLALKSGKTDAVLSNNAVSRLGINRNPDLTLFPESLRDGVFGFAFAKGSPERDTWQAAFDSIPQEKILALWNKWTGADDSLKVLPKQDWPGLNGTIRAAVGDTLEPMCYAGENGELIGFDVELILLMAKELDVHVQLSGMELASVLASVQTGKALIGASSIIVTEERKESVDFIEYYPAAFVLVVRSAVGKENKMNTDPSTGNALADKSYAQLEAIRSSFEKTFIREGRWKLFLSGIGNTLLITILSIFFGTILGFLIFMLCRSGNPAANTITAVCMWIVQGMPMVVLLMILFYVILGSVAIDGIIVAVIGFSLTFGAAVFGLLRIGVGTIDNGQYEAAYALGYSDRRTFYRIILPQAIPHVMGAYKGEIISLLKATAIVGYIAVQDLTKVGDIVRSRTYEAFFPLIAVTLIYFALEGLLGFLISRIDLQIDPKRRKREMILKGVKTND